MAAKFVSKRNLKFLLYEVFDATVLTQYPAYAMHNRNVFDMVLDAGLKLAEKLLRPAYEEMDRQTPQLEAGQVKAYPAIRSFMQEFGNGGWIAAGFPLELDGEQLPHSVNGLCRFIFAAANYSASVYPVLSAGAAHLITSFGSPELIQAFVPQMLGGKWQGTMALTEPQAGSSLADIMTVAEPDDEGHFRLRGQKIFISAGDHDGVDNVVHLMLARIAGAPPGVKGISLFVVPKKRIGPGGQLEANDITISQIYHKLGYRGTPITELSIGEKNNCHGYLVGEPHQGLRYMFQMMNEARIEVGLGATAIASAAYYAALDYCRMRTQGRPLGQKDPTQPQIPIIEHADVKRMLLFQRSVIEGSLALVLQCCYYTDLQAVSSEEAQRKYALLLDLLTPVAKTYPSEMGILSTSQAMQCFGGYGYCDDFPAGQYLRDIRIHPIHEGTTGIQGMDLLGRKVIQHEGHAMHFYMAEVGQTIEAAKKNTDLAKYAGQLDEALNALQDVTLHLIGIAQKKGPVAFLADATLYLELFGIITISWQWLKQAIVIQQALAKSPMGAEAAFFQGKWQTFCYYFAYELPKTLGLIKRLTDTEAVTLKTQTVHFDD